MIRSASQKIQKTTEKLRPQTKMQQISIIVNITKASHQAPIELISLLTPDTTTHKNIRTFHFDQSAMIGLFLHSAFPNSQILQILPQKLELLRSMLCADLIGFHLFEYAKNFVYSCRRLLELNYEFRRGGCLGIDVDGRRYVSLKIGHVGIEKECINEVILSQDFSAHFTKFFAAPFKPATTLIAAVDYLHPMSCIQNKLRAFQEFVRNKMKNDSRRVISDDVMLIQYLVPPKGFDYKSCLITQKMIGEIEILKNKINKECRCETVIIKYEGASKTLRCALWARANILLITCLRDGLCLQPLEFLAVKQFVGRLQDSAIILSEFAGVSQALPGIHKINPLSIADIRTKLEQVWAQTQEEKLDLIEQALRYLDNHSTLKWAHAFLKDLKRSHQPNSLTYYMGTSYNVKRPLGPNKFEFVNFKSRI